MNLNLHPEPRRELAPVAGCATQMTTETLHELAPAPAVLHDFKSWASSPPPSSSQRPAPLLRQGNQGTGR
jgi:hypothetical protein